MGITSEEPDSGLPWLAVLRRGAVVGVAVGAAQFAISLPQIDAGPRERPYLMMLAMYVGLPAAGLLVGGLVAKLQQLRLPGLMALLGLVLSVGLALMTLWFGVPHVTRAGDPGVLSFGALCAVPGYAAAALIMAQPRGVTGPLRSLGVVAAAVAVAVVGSLAWLEIAYLMRAQALRSAGAPFVVAEIPGHHLTQVQIGLGGDLDLYYSRSSEYATVVMRVLRPGRPPRTCAEAWAKFGAYDPSATHPCLELGDRWVFEPSGDHGPTVVATHAGAVVVLSGEEPGLSQATLRTSSARELAKAPPGWD